MGKYINTDEIKYHPIVSDGTYSWGIRNVTGDFDVDLFAAKEEIDAIPEVDVELVRHAHWIKHDRYLVDSEGAPVLKIGEKYECSLCGRIEENEEPYCNCGAKMDEKEIKNENH